MKLSELVELRERLKQAFYLDPVHESLDNLRLNLGLVNQNAGASYTSQIDDIIQDYRQLRTAVSAPSEKIQNIIDSINQEINTKASPFFLDNYEQELIYEVPENIRRIRIMYIPDNIRSEIESRIALRTNWKYPALEIGCRDGEWTKLLVAGDPLYLTDVHQEFLDSAIKDYPAEYQRRTRPYLIKNLDYSILPQRQFGFVFSWNYFNYKTIDSIKQALKEVYNLLRPGGVFMFSYNNGDMPAGAAYAESYFMSYVPKSMLIPACQQVGFEIIESKDFEPCVCWVELRKPGELTTVKGHQALGIVKEKE
jgi:SAM-dependent methyltransferase